MSTIFPDLHQILTLGSLGLALLFFAAFGGEPLALAGGALLDCGNGLCIVDYLE